MEIVRVPIITAEEAREMKIPEAEMAAATKWEEALAEVMEWIPALHAARDLTEILIRNVVKIMAVIQAQEADTAEVQKAEEATSGGVVTRIQIMEEAVIAGMKNGMKNRNGE